MPEHTANLLSRWIRSRGSKSQKIGGELFQLAYGGQHGRKETKDAIRTNQTHTGKENAYFDFWCKQECIEKVEKLVGMIGSL